MTLVGALLGALWGFLAGWYLAGLGRPASFLRVLGKTPAPHFEVDALAVRALTACCWALPQPVRARAISAVRRVPVRFLGPEDARLGAFPFTLRGGCAFVATGPGWERRLALALAHAARYAALGDADTAGKDRIWFAAAARAADVFSGAATKGEPKGDA